jgi:hypothetical protein
MVSPCTKLFVLTLADAPHNVDFVPWGLIVSFRLLHRPVLIGILCSAMVLSAGAAVNPMGMVVSAVNAHVAGANAAGGADVYAGDFFDTESGGSLRLKLGSTQIYLAAASGATLDEKGTTMGVKLTRGTLGFSSAAASHFQVETPVGIVRAADGQRAFGEVTILGPQKIMVAAYHGGLVVEGSGISRTIKEVDTYNITFVPASEPAGADPAPAAPKPVPALQGGFAGSLIFDGVVLGAAAVTGYLFWHYFTESDSTPQQ